jgi:hypothetical protein
VSSGRPLKSKGSSTGGVGGAVFPAVVAVGVIAASAVLTTAVPELARLARPVLIAGASPSTGLAAVEPAAADLPRVTGAVPAVEALARGFFGGGVATLVTVHWV